MMAGFAPKRRAQAAGVALSEARSSGGEAHGVPRRYVCAALHALARPPARALAHTHLARRSGLDALRRNSCGLGGVGRG